MLGWLFLAQVLLPVQQVGRVLILTADVLMQVKNGKMWSI
jgi:hypothetical protein